tara:strand:- start:1391 stop:2326 length:936 start_codon:yes stop_codon:yes gene_type:complete
MTGEIEATTITLNALPADPATNDKVRLGESGGSNNMLQIRTNAGYINIGANNGSYAHFYTDRTGGYYFNKAVLIDGGGQLYAFNDGLKLGTGTSASGGTDAITVANGSTDITVVGTTTSTGFIKAGGAPTEFLMADGSVTSPTPSTPLQFAEWRMIAHGPSTASNTKYVLPIDNPTYFTQVTLPPDHLSIVAGVNKITLSAGGIYEVQFNADVFGVTTLGTMDCWVEIGGTAAGDRKYATLRDVKYVDGAQQVKWNTIAIAKILIPVGAPNEDLYFATMINGSAHSCQAYGAGSTPPQVRTNIRIIRLGDA